jgi:uncharacterized SAM-binding protein YcdF (DUF218 family)
VGRDIKRLRDRESATPVPSPDHSTVFALKRKRTVKYGAVLLTAFLFAGFAFLPVLREIASLLIVEDPLRPAAAIVALGGQTPFREIEAAKLYHAGWAPQVFVVREAASDESQALQQLGIKKPQSWELSRAVLVQQGVPLSALVIPKGEGIGTLEELQAVYSALEHKNAAVILVTSKYHTRRTRLTWNYLTAGRSQPIVRAASQDPFDPDHWWQKRRFILSVVREYLGIVNYYAGFVV